MLVGFLLMRSQPLSNNLHQAHIQHRRQGEVLIEALLPAQRLGRYRLRPQFRKAKLLEGNMRQVEGLRTAVVDFTVDAVQRSPPPSGTRSYIPASALSQDGAGTIRTWLRAD